MGDSLTHHLTMVNQRDNRDKSMADPKGNLIVPVAFRSDGTIHSLELSDTDRLLIDADSPSLLRPIVKNTNFSNLSLPAGSSTQTILTIPSGETWRMTAFMHRYTGTVAGVFITARVTISGTQVPFILTNAFVSTIPVVLLLNLLLGPGTVIDASVNGATLNDDYQAAVFAERVF